MFVFGAILGILYAAGGYVQYDTTLLTSATVPLAQLTEGAFESGCVTLPDPSNLEPAQSCSALAEDVRMQTWEQRPSFMIFVVAVASILGWLLLMVMGGVGLVALPLDMIVACVPNCLCNLPLPKKMCHHKPTKHGTIPRQSVMGVNAGCLPPVRHNHKSSIGNK